MVNLKILFYWAFKHALLSHVSLCISWTFLVSYVDSVQSLHKFSAQIFIKICLEFLSTSSLANKQTDRQTDRVSCITQRHHGSRGEGAVVCSPLDFSLFVNFHFVRKKFSKK